MIRHQGHVSAALVLGGVDSTGSHLFTIAPHGSTDKLPYVTMGSGSLAAMAVFEAKWRPNMEVCIPFPFLATPPPHTMIPLFSAKTRSTSFVPRSPPVSSMTSAQVPMSTRASSRPRTPRCSATSSSPTSVCRRSARTRSGTVRPKEQPFQTPRPAPSFIPPPAHNEYHAHLHLEATSAASAISPTAVTFG